MLLLSLQPQLLLKWQIDQDQMFREDVVVAATTTTVVKMANRSGSDAK